MLLSVYLKLVPVFLFIVLGFVVQRRIRFDLKTLASVLIYILSPIVAFCSLARLQFSLVDFWAPFYIFGLTTALTLITRLRAMRTFSPARASSLAFCAGNPNMGFLGIPLIMAMAGDTEVGYQVLIAFLGAGICSYTVALFVLANGTYTARESIVRMLKLPFLYSIMLGLLASVMGLELPATVLEIYQLAKSGFVVVSMLLLGAALRDVVIKDFDVRALRLVFFYRFVVWPFCILVFVLLDSCLFHILNPALAFVLSCNAISPVAMNSVNFAAIIGTDQSDASLMVAISTVLSLALLPLLVYFVLPAH